MRFFLLSLATLSLASSLIAKGPSFVDPKHPFHVDADFRYIGNAKMKNHHGHLSFADSFDTLYFSAQLNEKNSLSLGLGYELLKFDWNKNPAFKGDFYNYANISLTWMTASMDRWRWVITNGVTVDGKDVDFKKTGVFYTFWWGRYSFSKTVGGHIGVLAYAGMHRAYALPILGFDWQIASAWRLHVIFPLDMSLRMYVNKNVFFSIMYASFGKSHYPRRVHNGIGRYKDGIFDVFSNGVELNANLVMGPPSRFEAGLGAGWNFGGHMRVQTRHNNHSKSYKYNGAPYGHAYLAFNF